MATIETLKTTESLPRLTPEQEQEMFLVLHQGHLQPIKYFDNSQFEGSKNIEICGIPSVGKTTAIINTQKEFSNLGYYFSINKQPNPQKLKDIGLSDFNIMIVLKTFEKILQNSILKKTSGLDVVYDRGGLGQIPFIQTYNGSETSPQETTDDTNFLYNHLGFRFDALIIINPNPKEFQFTKPNHLSYELLSRLYTEYQKLPELLAKLNTRVQIDRGEFITPPLIISYTEAVKKPADLSLLFPKILGSLFRF